jgi:hypothetical protein
VRYPPCGWTLANRRLHGRGFGRGLGAYRLLLVAFSTCSSRAALAEDDHQVIMVGELEDAAGPVMRTEATEMDFFEGCRKRRQARQATAKVLEGARSAVEGGEMDCAAVDEVKGQRLPAWPALGWS